MIIKDLFTWRWGTLGRWGNPPVHINSYHVSAIKLIWEIIWTGRLPHLSGLPHLTGPPYLHVNRPLLCFCVSCVSSWRFCTTWLTNFKGSYFKTGVDCRGTAPPRVGHYRRSLLKYSAVRSNFPWAWYLWSRIWFGTLESGTHTRVHCFSSALVFMFRSLSIVMHRYLLLSMLCYLVFQILVVWNTAP